MLSLVLQDNHGPWDGELDIQIDTREILFTVVKQ